MALIVFLEQKTSRQKAVSQVHQTRLFFLVTIFTDSYHLMQAQCIQAPPFY